MTNDRQFSDAQRELLFRNYAMVRECVSAIDICSVLGLDLDFHGRCRCPFHNGTDRNMKAYPGNRGFYCFVCHEHGDSIRLAQKLIGADCGYHDAAIWIDRTFHLNIFDNQKPTLRERVRQAELRARTHGGRV